MAKSSYERTLEKQAREAQKQAQATARREQATAIINGFKIVNGFRILDSTSEETLRVILDLYDGNENNSVDGGYEAFPDYIRCSIQLEMEKLCLTGSITSPTLYISGGWKLFLTTQGKNYFQDKEKAIAMAENTAENYHSPTRKKYDVFISHASSDKLDFVEQLYLTLRRLGINIFYDSEVLSWGDNWKQVILDGTAQSEFAIIVISNQFFGREWTEKELSEFLQQQNESGQKIILPLLHGISVDELKNHYPELQFIQSICTERYSKEEIAILLAKELIKRYK